MELVHFYGFYMSIDRRVISWQFGILVTDNTSVLDSRSAKLLNVGSG